jgi:hypothetical protein
MESNDFNDMPKDTMMVIGDIEKFVEFVTYNSIRKAASKLMFTLFERKSYASKIIEKYVTRYNDPLKEFAKIESTKYIIKSVKIDNEDTDDEFLADIGIAGKIKRGDIDRVVLKATNEILFKILADMTKDKLVKLCWDGENEDFVWMLRQPNEPDKVETKYVPPTKKKINKKQK